MFQQAQFQDSRTLSGQRQEVTVADKQIQTGGNPERASKRRSNSQTGTLQPSLSMRSTRPMLGETTLNMLEVIMLAVGRVSGFHPRHIQQEAVHECVAATCKSAQHLMLLRVTCAILSAQHHQTHAWAELSAAPTARSKY